MSVAVAKSHYEKRLSSLTKSGFVPSPYQEAVFRFVAEGQGNAFVDAVAGSGKTTTILKSLPFLPLVRDKDGVLRQPRVLYCVFSKAMAEEMKERDLSAVAADLTVSTTHSFGYQIVRQSFPKCRVSQYRVGDLVKTELPKTVPYAEYRTISAAVSKCVAAHKNAGKLPQDVSVADIADWYDEEARSNYGSTLQSNRAYSGLTHKVWEQSLDASKACDFDDMLYLPVALNLPFPQYDWVLVDESQDLNPCQIAFFQRMAQANPACRFLFVGDPYQSIFAFRGADPAAVERLIEEFSCTGFPLSVTYRCPQNVVAAAKTYVPHLTARDGAPEGVVSSVAPKTFYANAQPGDMILCRCVAPLVRECIGFLKQGKAAKVLGRDIGRSLLSLYRQHAHPLYAGNLHEAIAAGRTACIAKLVRPEDESLAQIMADRFDALAAIVPGRNPKDDDDAMKLVEDAINDIFDDKHASYTFSSIHKAKGLEKDTVWLLRPDLLPFPKTKNLQQEHNLAYVALTRAKQAFYFVTQD